ncbi:MAG TPA: FMN-binding negative transcriptional regulator [Lysobacter sp.]|nr:FMN-binding negative transcriptional regulator [Lysobacter sp.]
MRTSPLFTPPQAEIDALISRHPLALLVTAGARGFDASPLPLLLERDSSGTAALLGHFARGNPQIEVLEAQPEAMAFFLGPHGYISPSWLTDRTQAPTWNFCAVQMHVRVRIDRSPDAAREAVDRLTAHMEAGRPNAWSPADMGERYAKLLPAVVAFRAEVIAMQAKFKLGQNERPDVLAEILAATSDAPALHAAMRAANAGRLDVGAPPAMSEW